MTTWGWIFLWVSWGSLTYLTAWCFIKVFTAPFVSDDEEVPPTP